jgi:hypothetical protein
LVRALRRHGRGFGGQSISVRNGRDNARNAVLGIFSRALSKSNLTVARLIRRTVVTATRKRPAPKAPKRVRKITVRKPKAPASFKSDTWYSNAASAFAVANNASRRRGLGNDYEG